MKNFDNDYENDTYNDCMFDYSSNDNYCSNKSNCRSLFFLDMLDERGLINKGDQFGRTPLVIRIIILEYLFFKKTVFKTPLQGSH